MNKAIFFIITLAILLGFTVSSQATLYDRGGGLIYDDVLNVTWLQDANYAMTSGYDADGRMTWAETVAWVAQLVYAGYSDWRLPSSYDINGNYYGTPNWNDTLTEWGLLYYENLGNVKNQGSLGQYINVGPFINVQRGGYPNAYYWANENSLCYLFEEGLACTSGNEEFHAWPLRQGDVGVVANTYCVSSTQELHDALVEAQSNGQDDIIRIVQGTYIGNFIFASAEAYGLTVEGGYAAGCASRVVNPANTVLDGAGLGVVFVMSTPNKASNFIFDGITLKNGNATNNRGGGLFVSTGGGSAIVSRCTITNNSEGGVYFQYLNSLTLDGNNISQNTGGAGVWVASCTRVDIINNDINGNIEGNGIYLDGTQEANISGNNINNNSGSPGGGAYFRVTSLNLRNNDIKGNISASYGGGIQIVYNDTAILENNTINGNTSNWGGGIWMASINGRLFNNVISQNSSNGSGGGGVYIDAGLELRTTSFINNTIALNTANRGGGVEVGLYGNNTTVQIYNNIIQGNIAPLGSDIYIDNDVNDDYFPSIVELFYNNFDQSSSGTYIQIPFSIDPSNLNNVNPLFVDAANGNFHLQSGSPVINQGSNSAPNLPSTDKDGLARILYGIVDMGAYEYLCSGSYGLTATKEGTGSGSLSAPNLSCDGNSCTGTYNCGTTITITATADKGSHFGSWSGCDSTNSNLCTVTMAGSKSVSSTFTLDTHTLTATKAGTGTGSLFAPGLSCNGNTCTGTYDFNETVHITATADTGSVFGSWSGCDSVNGNVCTILINGDKSITASFYLEYTLLVHLEGTGDGRVVSTPSGIDCEPTCSDTFPVDTPVTLRAYPYGGSAFAYWSGACSGASTTCEITMSGLNEVFAHFVSDDTNEYKLKVKKSKKNGGDGTITSSDGYLDCSDICLHAYYKDTIVTLSAVANDTSTFLGWKPDKLNCIGTGSCTVTMDKAKTVQAVFVGDYRLKVVNQSKKGGTGIVTSTPSGISCQTGNTNGCQATYPYAEQVTLSASADNGSTFLGWSPAKLCPGTGNCTVSMDKKRTIKAVFSGE